MRLALQHFAVHRDLVARADHDNVIFRDLRGRDLALLTIAEYRGLRWRKIHQGANSVRGARAGTHFQPMAQQNEHQQHGHRFKKLHAVKEERRTETEQVAGPDGEHHQHRHIEHTVF